MTLFLQLLALSILPSYSHQTIYSYPAYLLMQGFCIVLNFTLDTSYHNWINESTLWVQVFALTFYLTFSKSVAFFPMTWNPPSKSVPIIEWSLPDTNSFMLVSYENFCFVSLCLMSNYSIIWFFKIQTTHLLLFSRNPGQVDLSFLTTYCLRFWALIYHISLVCVIFFSKYPPQVDSSCF